MRIFAVILGWTIIAAPIVAFVITIFAVAGSSRGEAAGWALFPFAAGFPYILLMWLVGGILISLGRPRPQTNFERHPFD